MGGITMAITPYEVNDIPVSSRKGSGRTSSIFTEEVINKLLNYNKLPLNTGMMGLSQEDIN